MSTVLLCVVVIGLCVAAIAVETLSSSGHQPATAHPERRSAWEPWRSIARRAAAHVTALWAVIRRGAVRFDRRMVAGGAAVRRRSAQAARATGRGARSGAGLAASAAGKAVSTSGSAAHRASQAARAGTRSTGRGLGRAGSWTGKAVVAGLSAVALAVLNVVAAIGSGVRWGRRGLRRARIAVSSFLARGLDGLDDRRRRRADRRAIRAVGGEAPPGSVSIAGPTLASTEGPRRQRAPEGEVWARPPLAPVPERPGARQPDRPGRPGEPPSPDGRRPGTRPRPGDTRGPAGRDDDRTGRRRPMRFPVTQSTPAGGYERPALAPVTPPGDGPTLPAVTVLPGSPPDADEPAGTVGVVDAPAGEPRDGGVSARSAGDGPPDVVASPTNLLAGPTRGAPGGDGAASSPAVDAAGGAGGAEGNAIPDPGPIPGTVPGTPDAYGRRDAGAPVSYPTIPGRSGAVPDPDGIPDPGPIPGPIPPADGIPDPGPVPPASRIPVAGAIPDPGPMPGSGAAHLARDGGKPKRRGRPGAGAKHLTRVKDRVVAEMLTPAGPADPTTAPTTPPGGGATPLGPAGSVRERLTRELLVPASAAPTATDIPRAPAAATPLAAGLHGAPPDGGAASVEGSPAPSGPGPAARVARRAGDWRESVARRREARRVAAAEAAAAAAAAAAIPPAPVLVSGEEVAAARLDVEGPTVPRVGDGVDTADHDDALDLHERDDTDTDLVPLVPYEDLDHDGPDPVPTGPTTEQRPRRRDGVPVRLPVPVTTRLWALIKLVALVTVLGLAVGGAIVALVVTVASALLG